MVGFLLGFASLYSITSSSSSSLSSSFAAKSDTLSNGNWDKKVLSVKKQDLTYFIWSVGSNN